MRQLEDKPSVEGGRQADAHLSAIARNGQSQATGREAWNSTIKNQQSTTNQ
jgi:hypothetical protein